MWCHWSLLHFTNLVGHRNHSISLHHNLNLHYFRQVRFYFSDVYIYNLMCIYKKCVYIKIILLHLFEPLKRPLASRLIKGTVSEVFPNVMIQEVLECHWEDRVQPARRLSRHWFVSHHLYQKSPTIYSKTVAAVLPPQTLPVSRRVQMSFSHQRFPWDVSPPFCCGQTSDGPLLCSFHSGCEFTDLVFEPKEIQTNMNKTSKHVLRTSSDCLIVIFFEIFCVSSVFIWSNDWRIKYHWKYQCCNYLFLQRHFVHVRANLALGGAFWQRLVRDVHILGLPSTWPRSRYNRVFATGAMALLDLYTYIHIFKCLVIYIVLIIKFYIHIKNNGYSISLSQVLYS